MGITSRSKKKSQPTVEQAQSWRKIRQAPQRKPLTAVARQRRLQRWGRALGLGSILIFLAVALVGGGYYWFAHLESQALRPPSAPLKQILFDTNGVLQSSWLRQSMKISKGQGILDIDIEVLKRRDPKGLYAKAVSGEIKNFTGITAPYEEPENADAAS